MPVLLGRTWQLVFLVSRLLLTHNTLIVFLTLLIPLFSGWILADEVRFLLLGALSTFLLLVLQCAHTWALYILEEVLKAISTRTVDRVVQQERLCRRLSE